MRVLIGCEFSGVVRRAFRAKGCDAWSCDLLPAEDGDPHHEQCDLADLIGYPHWDMVISFPPCTHLAVSGARWFKGKKKEQANALDFVRLCLDPPDNGRGAPRRICVENPIGVISTHICKPTQIIQPWQFGHGETKATCLWLRNLPPLKPTKIVSGRRPRVHYASPGPDRWKERSRTLEGIAAAMAEQWSN